MIDTVKIVVTKFNIRDYSIFKEYREGYIKEFFENPKSKDFKLRTYMIQKQDGIYRPSLFIVSNYELIYKYGYPQMYISFSAPKLLFGNNLEELTEKDFDLVVNKLIAVLAELQISVDKETIENAFVRRVDFSKNFILEDGLTCCEVINLLKTASYNRLKIITDIEENNQVKFHSKSLSILFYNKLIEMENNISEEDLNDILSERMTTDNIFRAEIQIKQKGIKNILMKKILITDYTPTFKQIFKRYVFEWVFDYILTNLNKKCPDTILRGQEIEELKDICKNYAEASKKSLLLEYQKKYGNYFEGISKAKQDWNLKDNFIKRHKCISIENDKLNCILLKFLNEIREENSCEQVS